MAKQRRQVPLGLRPLRQEITDLPNIVTLVRILLIPLVLICVDNYSPALSTLAAVVFIIAAASDALDGYLARRLGLVTVVGTFLDPLADKLIVLSTLIILVARGRAPAWLVILLTARELAVTGLRAIASQRGYVIAAGTGGKMKTALQLVGISFLLVHFHYNILFFDYVLNFHEVGIHLLYLSLVMSLVSAAEYFAFFAEAASKQAEELAEQGITRAGVKERLRRERSLRVEARTTRRRERRERRQARRQERQSVRGARRVQPAGWPRAPSSGAARVIGAAAVAAAARLAGRPGRVLLHSGRDDDGCGRYSFVTANPLRTIEARGRRVLVRDRLGAVVAEGEMDPFAALEELVSAAEAAAPVGACDGPEPVPIGIGFLGYDLGRVIERIPERAEADTDLPDMGFGIYGAVWRRDERTGREEIVGVDDGAVRELGDWLQAGSARPGARPVLGELRADWDRDEYDRAVQAVLEYIAAGDVYQVNIARRLRAPIQTDGDALALYTELERRSPSAFGGVIEMPWARLVSGSPERFLARVPGETRVETRPIKGTRERTGDEERDVELARDLRLDEKERAEHLMIVDLERNDLGRVARFGSVRVEDFARVVELPTLFHLVSTVSAQLRPEAGSAALLRATFPGGSITGAPKVRAMEIIDELEPTRRGPYTGTFGYLGARGAVDLGIAIRIAVLWRDEIHLHVGGGIVADSTPARELVETEEKAAAWRAALAACSASAR